VLTAPKIGIRWSVDVEILVTPRSPNIVFA